MSVAADMSVALAALESNLLNAETATQSTWFFPGVGGGDSAEGLLYVCRRAIATLRELQPEVLAGRRSFLEWKALADSTNEDLRYLVKTLPALSWSGVAGGAAADFVSDAKTAVPVVAGGLAGVAVLALGLIIFLQFGRRT